ncbi:MAG TPA: DNA ligase D [Puia sp.]|nr:DNA ligase D [Puia sp.]
MALKEYNKKRRFDETPEPVGGVSKSRKLQFVVQEHDATRLHYDFRLEMDGVLKSWAIPKGPSMNPQDKRLAMMVEDHPFDYKDFEGVIPDGNYGAGSVIVWDRGTYEPLGKTGTKQEQEKELLQELKSGSLKLRLFGEKLKGEIALVHIKSGERGDNAWLLIKHKDEYATDSDITRKSKSVRSGKTVEQVGRDNQAEVWVSNRQSSGKKKEVVQKKTKAKKQTESDPDDLTELLNKGRKSPMPKNIRPMLATTVEKPFDGEDWLYEIKWDGYRAVANIRNGKASIESRNNLSFDDKFPAVKQALEKWPVDAVVDGEIVALDRDGKPDFQELQRALKGGEAKNLVYYVFDLLWYQGKDYTGLPLIERKTILSSLVPADDEVIRYSDHVLGKGISFFDAAIRQGLEGIMAKKADSRYTTDHRSQQWLKIKNNRFTEAIICGFTTGRNARKYFGALILGRYEGKELKYMGHTGSGFDDKELKSLYARLKPLIIKDCPFKVPPKTNMPATWVKPEFVCMIKYTETTRDGSLRHPIFAGLREDKHAKDEKNTRVVKAPEKTRSSKNGSPAKKKTERVQAARAPAMRKASGSETPSKGKATSKKSMASDQLVDPSEKNMTITVQRRELTVTNLSKIYWPEEKIRKGDLINYYHRMAEYILPFLKDRPQSLNRYPDGIKGEAFYQKNIGDKHPGWIETYRYRSESDGQIKYFLVARDEASLIYMANLGCIEMHPWNSRVRKPDNPDWCVIDLDPGKTNTFNQVIDVALEVKAFLDSFKITGYCKTSGATGMHVYIPLGAKYSYDQSRLFAEMLVTAIHQRLPKFTSLERNLAKRGNKMYLDYLQNRQIQTIAAPYSLRPRAGATVSMPLHWEEVRHGLKPSDFNINNALDRIREEPDLFKGVLGKGINLLEIIKKMEADSADHSK